MAYLVLEEYQINEFETQENSVYEGGEVLEEYQINEFETLYYFTL